MRFFLYLCLLIPFTMKSQKISPPALVIHGGAGTILKENMTPELEKLYKAGLEKALKAGYDTLMKGGTAMDAVEMSIRVLEDDSMFNAGKGSVFTHSGTCEMDASVMDGKTGKAGSIAGVKVIKNPITTARGVMEKSQHVMLIGTGAEEFAKMLGHQIVDPSYFHTQKRMDQLKKIRESEKIQLDHSDTTGNVNPSEIEFNDKKFGTVGCVALDQYGNIAAGTSTGGMTNKKWGRVGDAPIIGAGTYANNKTCAVSCTGHGEYFIRQIVAYDVSALMEYKGYSLQKAAEEVVNQKLKETGGEGGLIGIDTKGNMVMVFNTSGMYRGWMKGGKSEVKIYKE
ncbi:MAG: isoaspartyl peptidase/L-asparaginase [Bacteroidia bacterium]|nr:isoaspartyl peptidase/L-asparaginase [Bacteroidia bacterium]